MSNRSLVVAGVLSFIASALHVAVIIGGAEWYLFFGAGEEMAALAQNGSLIPLVTTSLIAVVLLVWGLYAFSGAGLIRRFPFLRFCLVVITAVYLVRGMGGIVIAFMPRALEVQGLSFSFMIWSSLICVAVGVAYLLGTYKGWKTMSVKNNK